MSDATESKKMIADMKALADSVSGKAFIKFLNKRLVVRRDENMIGTNEFETIKRVFYREGAIEELQLMKNVIEYPEQYVG
jgi:hypothetical protein